MTIVDINDFHPNDIGFFLCDERDVCTQYDCSSSGKVLLYTESIGGYEYESDRDFWCFTCVYKYYVYREEEGEWVEKNIDEHGELKEETK